MTGLLLALAATPSVLVFPFEGPDGLAGPSEHATRAAVEALGRKRATGPHAAQSEHRIDLGALSAGCDRDIFCLAEVGRLLSAEWVVVGRIEPAGEGWRVAVQLIDVLRASLLDSVRHEIPTGEWSAVAAASAAAARRLLDPAMVGFLVRVDPPTARVLAFGGPVDRTGETQQWWPGRWWVRAEAPGYKPAGVWVDVQGPGTVEIELSPDPLALGPAAAPSEPFDRPSRRILGGGARVAKPPAPTEAWASRPLPWLVAGVGVAAIAVGSVLVVDAQSRYRVLAGQERGTALALPADLAAAERDGLRDQHRVGSALAGAGGLVAGVSLVLFAVLQGTGR